MSHSPSATVISFRARGDGGRLKPARVAWFAGAVAEAMAALFELRSNKAAEPLQSDQRTAPSS